MLNNYNKLFKCMENDNDRKQLKVIQKREERLDETLDLKKIIKEHHKICFFQKIILKKLDIKYKDY